MAADSLTKATPLPLFEYHRNVIMGHPQTAGVWSSTEVGTAPPYVFSSCFGCWGVDGLNTVTGPRCGGDRDHVIER
eukprot:1248670-Rhodomonas_salina.1